jgi:hypothetical protein
MSTELEHQLRTDMERFTRDLHAPHGLAARAFRHNQKRRMVLRIATAAGSAAVLAGGLVTAVATAGNSGSAPPLPTRTAAYVVSRVSRALAPANAGRLISYSSTVLAPGSGRVIIPAPTRAGRFPAADTVCPSSRLVWCARDIQEWSYGGDLRESVYSTSGQHTFDLATTTHTQTAVSYLSRTWWTAPFTPLPAGRPRGPVCAPVDGLRCEGGWPAYIRSQLAAGSYAIVGHQVVDGVDAIKISVGAAKSSALLHGYLQRTGFVLWVDPTSYLPVRLRMTGQQQDFRWLRPTVANLARTRLTVPAGFRQVTPPPAAY